MVIEVCDPCFEAGVEETGVDEEEEEVVLSFLQKMGADIADHLCDNVEVGMEAKCQCPCGSQR